MRLIVQDVARLLLIVVQFVAVCQASVAAPPLPCAGQGDHIWFAKAAELPPTDFELCHHGRDLGGPFFKRQAGLSLLPDAMASWGEQVWMVFTSQISAGSTQREVYSVQVERHQALGVYRNTLGGRPELLAPLPGGGRLVSFVGLPDGPVALLWPEETDAVAAANATTSAAAPKLLQLRGGRWDELELPGEAAGLRHPMLGVSGHAQPRLVLIASTPQEPGRAIRFDRNHAGQWTRSTLPFDATELRKLITVNGQLAALWDESAAEGKKVGVGYVRASGIVRLTAFAPPEGRWGAIAYADMISILEQSEAGELTLRTIDPVTGEISESQALVAQVLPAAKLWQISIILAVAISVVLLVFTLRPQSRAPVTLPGTLVPLNIFSRLSALVLDMLPAGIVTTLLLRCSMSDLLKLPILTIDFEEALPYLVMAGLTVAHTTVTELVKVTTLGKAIMGARIVASDGSPASRRMILLRCAVKAVVFLVPPLAVFTLASTNVQGLADLAAGTLVVHDAAEAPDPDIKDR